MESTKRKDVATTTRESYGIKESEMTTRIVTDSNGRKHITTEPLLHPPQRTWVGLTDEDISEIVRGTHNTGSFVRAIEAKLKEKNT